MNIVVRRRPSPAAHARREHPFATRGRRSPSVPTLRVLGHLAIDPMPAGTELRRRVRELLALVVCHRSIGRDTAAYLLWPDKDLESARRNLRVTLTHLMRVVEHSGGGWVTTRAGVLSIDTAFVGLDLDEFIAAEARGRRAERSGHRAQALAHFERALGLYRGGFLLGLDVDGVQYERLRLEVLAFDMAISAARAARAIGEPDRAASLACRALAIDPLGDVAAAELAAAVRAMGRDDAARLTLEDHVDALRRAGICPSRFIDAHASHLRIA